MTVSFAGNKYYNPSKGSEIFTVSKLASVVEVTPQNITVDDDEIIKFTVTGDGSVAPSGNVTITITGNDIEYSKVIENTPISSGEAGVKVSGLPAGTYTVKVEYGGDGNYNASSDTKTFKVDKRDVKVEVLTDVIGYDGDEITVIIKDV